MRVNLSADEESKTDPCEVIYRTDCKQLATTVLENERLYSIQRVVTHLANPILTLITATSMIFLDQRTLNLSRFEHEQPDTKAFDGVMTC